MTDELLHELEAIKKLLAVIVISQPENQTLKEKVSRLNQAGLGPTEIAPLVGSTANSVSVRLAEIRRARA